MMAGKKLLERLGAVVVEGAAIIDLPELGGSELLRDGRPAALYGDELRRPLSASRRRMPRSLPRVLRTTHEKVNAMPNFLLFLATSIAITVRARSRQSAGARARHLAGPRGGARRGARLCGRHHVSHDARRARRGRRCCVRRRWRFEAIKLAGAAYLIWIGIKALRSQRARDRASNARRSRLSSMFRQSVIGNLLNPKVTLFFVVFLPQFVQPHGAQSVTRADARTRRAVHAADGRGVFAVRRVRGDDRRLAASAVRAWACGSIALPAQRSSRSAFASRCAIDVMRCSARAPTRRACGQFSLELR